MPHLIIKRRDSPKIPSDIADVFTATDGNFYPKLRAIQKGEAFFESSFPYAEDDWYRISCKISLTDPLFQGEKLITCLPPSKALPVAIFSKGPC